MSAPLTWYDALPALAASGERCVLVTVAEVRGSAPREAGTSMLVTPRATIGTIGGGQLEYEATGSAHAALERSATQPAWLQRYPLGPSLGQCCGGHVSLLYEVIDAGPREWHTAIGTPGALRAACVGGQTCCVMVNGQCVGSLGDDALDFAVQSCAAGMHRLSTHGDAAVACLVHAVAPRRPRLTVFGAGHVGKALVRVAESLPWSVHLVDSRAHEFPTPIPSNVEAVCVDDALPVIDALPAGSACLVMTHSHALDLALVARILARDDIVFCGLIGSLTKRRRFEKQLHELGLSKDTISRLVCPIGTDGISSKEPAAIAVATVAQLLPVLGPR